MNWSVPEPPFDLGPGEVHLWRIPLTLDDGWLGALAQTLSEEERERAARFRFPELRRRFIAAHGAMRELLSAYLGASASELAFTLSKYGKPSLAGAKLHFNLSHSAELALLAVTHDADIGVDIEFVRPGVAREKIAERFFSPREVAALRRLPEDLQNQGFFSCWTRKEAFIKAVGEGLSYPLDAFDVTLEPGEPAALLAIRGDRTEALRWTMGAFSPGENYAGAFAVESRISKVSYWEWLRSERRHDQHGRERRQDHLQGSCEPRGAVFDLAGRPGEPAGLE